MAEIGRELASVSEMERKPERERERVRARELSPGVQIQLEWLAVGNKCVLALRRN